jgi:hypothetical protein
MIFVGMILCSLFLVVVWRVDFEDKVAVRKADAASARDTSPLEARG